MRRVASVLLTVSALDALASAAAVNPSIATEYAN
jgi:hypothetical protein